MRLDERVLVVHLKHANKLRDSCWFGGKNDVYGMAYLLENDEVIQPGAELPTIDATIELEPITRNFPFKILLPEDLPSTHAISSRLYIEYSIYAYIDIAWRSNPNHRAFFTVVQPRASAMYMQPSMRLQTQEVHSLCACCINDCTRLFDNVTRVEAKLQTGRSGNFTFALSCTFLLR
jgi:hypothetical protein